MQRLEPGMIVFDEASDIPEQMWRAGVRFAEQEKCRAAKLERRRRAEGGWFNWYANRGRLSLNPTKSELRRVSWRRAH